MEQLQEDLQAMLESPTLWMAAWVTVTAVVFALMVLCALSVWNLENRVAKLASSKEEKSALRVVGENWSLSLAVVVLTLAAVAACFPSARAVMLGHKRTTLIVGGVVLAVCGGLVTIDYLLLK